MDSSDEMVTLSSHPMQHDHPCWLVVHQFLEQFPGFLVLIQQGVSVQNNQGGGGWEPETPDLNPLEQMICGQTSSTFLQISAQRNMSWGPKDWEQTKTSTISLPALIFLSQMLSDSLKKSHFWRTADVTVVRDAHYSLPAFFTERNHRPCMACFHQVFFHASLSYYVFATYWILSFSWAKKKLSSL